MRLSTHYHRVIKKYTEVIFGNRAEVFLFGSRTDDTQKGGDIDLYIIPHDDEKREELFDKKIAFLGKLQEHLGEQKIDILLAKNSQCSIEREALTTGIRL